MQNDTQNPTPAKMTAGPVRPPRPGRRRRATRGSVLILVVALLVLMALIGTAWISTARVDRAATIQHTNNTQVDLLVEGVVNQVRAALISDIIPDQFRSAAGAYRHADDMQKDAFLAPRVPVLMDEVAWDWETAQNTLAGVAPVTFQVGTIVRYEDEFFVCRQAHSTAEGVTPTDTEYWYPLPAAWSSSGPTDRDTLQVVWSSVSRLFPEATFEDLTGRMPETNARGVALPWFVTVNGKAYPALRFFHPGALGGDGALLDDDEADPMPPMIAGDADGDGIADSLLSRIKVGRLNGLDYFYSIKVVDENSAVNLNTAWLPSWIDSGSLGGSPDTRNFTTANVSLVQPGGSPAPLRGIPMLFGPPQVIEQQLHRLNWDRMTRFGAANANTAQDPPYAPDAPPLNDHVAPPAQFSETRRDDFTYPNAYELLAAGLGRRVDNPGAWEDSNGIYHQFVALSSGDMGALRYKGGFLLNPDAMLPDPTDPSGNRLMPITKVERSLIETLFDTGINHPTNGMRDMARAYSFEPGRVPDWFRIMSDYGNGWTPPEEPALPNTWRNRRPLVTLRNPVTTAVPSRAVVRGTYAPGTRYEFGEVVDFVAMGISRQHFVCLDPWRSGLEPDEAGAGGTPAALDLPPEASGQPHPIGPVWEPRPFTLYPHKASVNTSGFGSLWLAYWNVFVRDRFPIVVPNGTTTPFSDIYWNFYRNFPGRYADPYIGNRFIPGYLGPPSATVTSFARALDPDTDGPEEHPARMLRSPLRPPPAAAGDPFTDNHETMPRYQPDEVARLRSSIAAVNTIDLRDPDDDVTVQRITLAASLPGEDRPEELRNTPAYKTPHIVTIYGNEAQPFITEVFAHTDTAKLHPRDPLNRAAAAELPNLAGYIAIELHNPYPFPIDIRYCKIATINRDTGGAAPTFPTSPARRGTNNLRRYDLGGAGGPATFSVFDHADPANVDTEEIVLADAISNLAGGAAYTAPTVIPPNGYLVLENFRNTAGTTPPARPARIAQVANGRPASMNLLMRGGGVAGGQRGVAVRDTATLADPITGTINNHPQVNFAFVQNLDLVLGRELVLVRPKYGRRVTGIPWNAEPPATVTTLQYYHPADLTPSTTDSPDHAAHMVPLDSFDFTGLYNPDPLVNGGTAYARAYAWHYSRASNPTAGKAWRFVYPGRYDARQSREEAPGAEPVGSYKRPRQQGTQEAFVGGVAAEGALLGWTVAPDDEEDDPWDADPSNPTAVIPQPGPSLGSGTAINGVPENQSSATYPVEFTIQLSNTGWPGLGRTLGGVGNFLPFGQFARNGDILHVPFIGAYRVQTEAQFGTNMVTEFTAITMDAAFAEDTDPLNDPPLTVTPTAGDFRSIYHEQVGRFVPTLADLGIGANGTAIGATTPGRPNVAFGQATDASGSNNLEDATRRESAENFWQGYEIEITDGLGKGQVRTVIASTNGELTIDLYRPWDIPPDKTSKYVLRRGAYRWASDLLDYLAVETPQEDFLPNADPSAYMTFVPGDATTTPPGPNDGRWVRTAIVPPQAVQNADATKPPAVTYGVVTGEGGGNFDASTNLSNRPGFYQGQMIQVLSGPAAGHLALVSGYNVSGASDDRSIRIDPDPPADLRVGDVFRIFGVPEDTTPTHGLVNINTAPWPVLATLPFVQDPAANVELAKSIARWRDGDPSQGQVGYGPFRSIFDLYKVPQFLAANAAIVTAAEPNDTDATGGEHGDYTPFNLAGTPATDLARYDFEEQFLLMNRVSNLITTRSDSFTCYVLVQGWRGVGTPTPELVVQRRRAFLTDRSGLTPVLREMPLQYFYNE